MRFLIEHLFNKRKSGGPQSEIRHPLRTRPHRAGDGAEPLLPDAACDRHGLACGRRASAALRGIKAEGGWGVVNTEYCSIHPSSDDFPYGFVSLWDDDDVRSLASTADAVHAHGSLAGVELWHGGFAIQQPADAGADARSFRPAGPLHPAARGAGHGQGRHPQSAHVAAPGGGKGEAGRVRHRLCLCRPWIICRSSSCRRAPTGGPTNMAAASKIARGSSTR